MGIVDEFKKFGLVKVWWYEMVIVMFFDFKGFLRIFELLEFEELVVKIDYCFWVFDCIIEKYGLEKIKIVGDVYLCVGGIVLDDDVNDVSNVVYVVLEI